MVGRPVIVGAFAARPRLVGAVAAGVVVGALMALAGRFDAATSVIVGWDAGCLAFCALLLPRMSRGAPAQMRAEAARDDEGRVVILVLVLLAAAFSLGAVAVELSTAREAQGLARAAHVTLAVATLALSWFMVQLNFAVHYAHAYYDRGRGARKGDAGGLVFPGQEPPDYWDFLHFAVIIGVACQTADVAITSRALRRLNTGHALFAFAYNTVIVALTINLLAGLF